MIIRESYRNSCGMPVPEALLPLPGCISASWVMSGSTPTYFKDQSEFGYLFVLKIANWKQNVVRAVLAACFRVAVCLFKPKWYKQSQASVWVCILQNSMCTDNVQFYFVVCNNTCQELKEPDNKQTAPSVAWLCWRGHLWFIAPSHCLWPSQGIPVTQAYGFCGPLKWQWFCLLVQGCTVSRQEQATGCC